MTPEQIAKLYEMLSAYSILRAKEGTSFAGHSVAREINLPGVNIRSDVVLSDPDGSPNAVFLITHSSIEVHWAEKFKRDSAEFIDLAISDLPVRVVCLILYDARTLPGLELIAKSFLTGIVRVPDLDPGGVISAFAHSSKAKRVIDCEDQLASEAELERQLSTSPRLRDAFNAITNAIRILLSDRQSPQGQQGFFSLTRAMVDRRRAASVPRLVRHTRFNRSISKLALLSDGDIAVVANRQSFPGDYAWATLPVFWQMPRKAKGPMLNTCLGGQYRCVDPEIIGGLVGGERSAYSVESVLASLSEKEIVAIIAAGRQEMLKRYCDRIRAPEVNCSAVRFIMRAKSQLIRKGGLAKIFREVSESPHSTFEDLCGAGTACNVGWHWLYTAIVSTIKAVKKKKQGFGYSMIAKRMVTPRFRSAVEHSILQGFEYCTQRVSPALIEEVADSMASYLSEINLPESADVPDEATKYLVWSEVEDKVIPHGVDVLPAMIEMAAARNKLVISKEVVTSCLADAVSSAGTSGRTNVYRIGDTLVWYKAGHYRQNILHKRHEMQTVIAGWKQQWDRSTKHFVPASGHKKVVIVIDGDWLEEDLAILGAFGCDEFLYPDELDRLPAVVV